MTTVNRAALIQEFTVLRRGYGIQATKLGRRIGPEIRRVCDIGTEAPDPEIRAKVDSTIRRYSRTLTVQDRRAIEVALGTERSGLLRLLSVRTEQLAAELSLSPRTARRRIDRAFELLVEEMMSTRQSASLVESDPEKGWWVTKFESLLRLDTPTPELVETRTIQATRDGLSRIVARMSLPKQDGAPEEMNLIADLQQGARIIEETRSGAYFRYLLELPKPLALGDEHVYTIAYKVPPGQPIRTHYAFVPMVACDEFKVRVRFDPKHPPEQVWKLDRLPVVNMTNELKPGEPIALDGACEAYHVFYDMEQNHGYGIAWRK